MKMWLCTYIYINETFCHKNICFGKVDRSEKQYICFNKPHKIITKCFLSYVEVKKVWSECRAGIMRS